MCGIVFVKSKDEETTRLVSRLQFEAQKRRGLQGFGLLELDSGEVHRSLTEKEFQDVLADAKGSGFLIHHRLPTSTDNTLIATHPFIVECEDLKMAVVHNGVIINPDEVLEKLKVPKENLSSYDKKKDTYNDSEALALDFVQAVKNKRDTLYSSGSIAIVAYELNKKSLYVYRNERNPLKFWVDGRVLIIASETIGGSDIVVNRVLKVDLATLKSKELFALKTAVYSYSAPVVIHQENHSSHSYFRNRNGQSVLGDGKPARNTVSPISGSEGAFAHALSVEQFDSYDYEFGQELTHQLRSAMVYAPFPLNGHLDHVLVDKDKCRRLDGFLVPCIYHQRNDKDTITGCNHLYCATGLMSQPQVKQIVGISKMEGKCLACAVGQRPFEKAPIYFPHSVEKGLCHLFKAEGQAPGYEKQPEGMITPADLEIEDMIGVAGFDTKNTDNSNILNDWETEMIEMDSVEELFKDFAKKHSIFSADRVKDEKDFNGLVAAVANLEDLLNMLPTAHAGLATQSLRTRINNYIKWIEGIINEAAPKYEKQLKVNFLPAGKA